MWSTTSWVALWIIDVGAVNDAQTMESINDVDKVFDAKTSSRFISNWHKVVVLKPGETVAWVPYGKMIFPVGTSDVNYCFFMAWPSLALRNSCHGEAAHIIFSSFAREMMKKGSADPWKSWASVADKFKLG